MTAEDARWNMVAKQLAPNNVTDSFVLEAMRTVPREDFIAGARKALAYADCDVPLERGRTLMAPVTLGRMLQAAEIRETDLVLDVGCATGYSAAVLARMASMVVAIEADPEMAARAESILSHRGVDNVAVLNAPHATGCPRQAPFDLIFIDGTLEAIPEELCHQLTDTGRLVMGLRVDGLARIVVVRRFGTGFGHEMVFDTQPPDLPGFERAPADAL
ncbi:protein-L-isoaspartate O-methyltransferase [Phaeovibrio sulfidiphilus]|uniref:Protein-L-isoaspartate O-methyltransferase n=1 Tax=Phaeovibrio sulfidiphilus TaxID=1220600 RepID=A0A8J7CVC9_9PROT|nr:protein-L-isoaspartate O-methyltransferase [Phaeovibrio sulfidiphilus]MBE1236151.1 protein-L-isoaspartate O-methyltransferase [Phaeovibrio sulfidiphilus]